MWQWRIFPYSWRCAAAPLKEGNDFLFYSSEYKTCKSSLENYYFVQYSLLEAWSTCTRMCIYERERERETECNRKCPAQHGATILTAVLLFSCVTSKIEKKYCSERCNQVKREGCRLLTRSDIAFKDFISCKPLLVLWKRVFWVLGTCGWVTASQSFKGMCRLHFQGYESVNLLIFLNGKTVKKRRK